MFPRWKEEALEASAEWGTKKRAILLVHAILPALGTFQSLLNVLGCVSGKQHFGGLEKFTATHSVLVYLEIN